MTNLEKSGIRFRGKGLTLSQSLAALEVNSFGCTGVVLIEKQFLGV